MIIKFLCAASVALLLVFAEECRVEQHMKFQKIEYFYPSMEEAPQLLTIDANGRARYESHSNEATPDYPEIGIFQTTLSGDDMESLRSLLTNPPFRDLPDHWGRVRPGEIYRRIRVAAGTETVEKLVSEREPVDGKLQNVINRLDQIIAQAMRHPVQTLHSELSQVSADSAGAVTATLTLSNRGTENIWVRNPLSMSNAPDAHLSFQAWPDKPASDLRAEDQVSAQVVKVEDIGRAKANAAEQAVIELPPRATVSFRIHASLPLRGAGAYLGRVEHTNGAARLVDKSLFVGELFSRPVRFDVQ